jgi:hypothetical protein
MIGFRLLLGQGRTFSFATASRPVLRLTHPLTELVPIISLWVKRLERETEHAS